jgi:hypothetical protein
MVLGVVSAMSFPFGCLPVDNPRLLRDGQGAKSRKGHDMPKIELTVTDEEKAAMQFAADRVSLRLATWARAKLMNEAKRSMPVYATNMESPRVARSGE